MDDVDRPLLHVDPDAAFGGKFARQELEQQLVWKLDKRCSILVVIYVLNYIDRNNASAARLNGFERDLHLTDNQFARVLAILYVGYLVMQIPSNMFLVFMGRPSVYLPSCMIIWGALSACTGLATNFFTVMCMRFGIGFFEAAFFPGALFLLSKWYTRRELSQRMALLSSGSLISNAFGSLIASSILESMDGAFGFAAWRWLFFLEGGLTVAIAILAIFILPDFPESSSAWLSVAEQTLARRRMAEDAGLEADSLTPNISAITEGLKSAIWDWQVWWLAIALTFVVMSLSFNAYFPTLAETMGYGRTLTLLLCAPPWFVATFVAFTNSRHSDQHGERFWHITWPLIVGILGFLLAMATMNAAVRYLSLFFMASSYAGFICFLAWISGTIRDSSKRAVSLALINTISSVGNLGSDAVRLVTSRDPLLRTLMKQLLERWEFTQIGGGEGTKDNEWLPVSTFPTTVHVELLALKKIPDPFLGLAEWDVQWVGEAAWAFRTTFVVEQQKTHTDLVFDGLDTFANVTLNGTEILRTENQFVSHRVPVKQHLKDGPNELVIHFDSAFAKGRELEKQNGKLNLWNGDSSRLHVRKAQYNYGWDWGPVLMTTGPWKPIVVESYDNRVNDVDIRTRVSDSFSASLSANFNFTKQRGRASFVLKRPDGTTEFAVEEIPMDDGRAVVSRDFAEGAIQLWYPVHYGAQPMYTAEIRIVDEDGNVLDSVSQKIAFRRVVVVQEPLVDQPGLTFLFEVNGVRVFCGGSNWIPADSFLTTVAGQRYRDWLQLLVNGNQNMIRVWGGGIYEADVFYDTCDELGILVWQDFMFGCGQYPAYDRFLDSVQAEAQHNVRRLRHHPSVVIFAGNNEDYQIAESLNLELDYNDEKSDFRKTNFPARHIYERVLPAIVEDLSDIYYHRGSPYSGHGKVTTDKLANFAVAVVLLSILLREPWAIFIKCWNVWHGTQEPWHNWDQLAGRFVSEFGMEAYPNIRTVDYWLDGNTSERFPQSRTNVNHNKADGFERRLELYLVENFRHSFDMESYVYFTQIMQAECLAAAYRLWRRNWAGPGRQYTAGALVWQINDCWPVVSWSICDYFLRPKPAYFSIARELRPFTVGMTRKDSTTFPDELSAAKFTIDSVLEIWGTNSTLVEKQITLEVTSFDLDSDCWRDQWTKSAVLQPNSSTELFKGPLPGQPVRTKKSDVPKPIVVSARLLDASGEVLARYSNWPEPFKFLNFGDPAIEVKVDGEQVTLSTNRPVKGKHGTSSKPRSDLLQVWCSMLKART
ncbi:Beta-mannosidase B [Mycena chlorophos]|uniref:Beta-mannosidase B n=1 Tax=Mycena chlorophos TaxID=658473 RepID=A0A8H6T903_MYCCL|nr:Beta-mannosidase B [Mycena chlorophos]